MSSDDNAEIRKQIRLLLDEANSLKRGWAELLPELDSLGWDEGSHEIIGRIRGIVQKLEDEAEKLSRKLTH